MHRIAEEQEGELRVLLDRFRSDHPTMRIEPRMLDLRSCFLGSSGKVSVPNYWYDGKSEPSVKAYVVRDGPILKKFNANKSRVNEDGRKVYERTRYKETNDFKVLAMLCANQTRNTAMSEFLDFGWESWNPAGISTLDKRILKIEHTTRMSCRGDFNPLTDNAFIFCREKSEGAENAVKLNAIWMGLIGKMGGGFFDYPPFPYETALARKVFPEDFFLEPTEEIIRRESYQCGIKAHTKESEWFVGKLAERYKDAEDGFLPTDEEALLREMGTKKRILDFVESRGDEGTDYLELVDRGVVRSIKESGSIFFYLHAEGGLGSVIQDPPAQYLKDPKTRNRLHKLYGIVPYYRIYGRAATERLVQQGKAVEALGVELLQLPHYVLSQPAAAEA